MRKFLILLWLLAVPSFAALPPANPLGSADNSQFYYQIGGATSIIQASNVNMTPFPLSGSLELGLGYSCGKFDPFIGLKNAVTQVTNLVNVLQNAITAAISALPLFVLQRANPGLYDLFQNISIKAEAVLALANQSCEAMEREIKKGNNPYEAWTDLSKSIDWKVEMKSGVGDVSLAKKHVESNNGQNGVPWVGGSRAGGTTQAPIKMTRDVVQAGYNLHLNRGVTETTAYVNSGGGRPPRLAEIWPSPADLTVFASQVLGDITIRTFDDHPEESVPGMGLLPSIESDQSTITTRLKNLVNGTSIANLANLKGVSSNDLLVTDAVIKAIQTLPPTEQAIAISKLASEIAMSVTLEKAILLRRVLLSGKHEPNIVKTAAVNHIDTIVSELDRDIDEVLFEKRIHSELAANTASFLLELSSQHQNRGREPKIPPGSDAQAIVDGAAQ